MPEFPDADSLILQILKAEVSGGTYGTQIPDDLATGLPFTLVRRIGGAAIDPSALERATFSVDVWAASRKAAWTRAASCRYALRDAWLEQTTYPLGFISFYREVSAPAELRTPEQLDGLWRFQATYSLNLRPAPAS